jgi:solute carrier family 25 iron transporter 28/37
MMNIPFASAVVFANENLKTWIKPAEKQNPHLWYFLCAGIAGGFAGIITNPLDVVKTRIQTQEVRPSCKGISSMWDKASTENRSS